MPLAKGSVSQEAPAEAPGASWRSCPLTTVLSYLSTLNFLFCFAISSESSFSRLPSYHRETSNTIADCALSWARLKIL